MANADIVAFNISAFIATLFLLEFGADKFIDHTVIVARRTGIPDSLIGLLIVGGEWKQVCPCTSPLQVVFHIESLYS